MLQWLIPLAVLLGSIPLWTCGGEGADPPSAAGEATGAGAQAAPLQALEDDPRVADLIYDCLVDSHYDRDLSDPIPILLEKLERGQADPLHRAKEELAAMGSQAMPHIKRLFDRNFADLMAFAYLQNALDVANMTEAPEAREVLLAAISHPRDTVRVLGVQGLARRHARPEDYDLIRPWVDLTDNSQLQQAFASALFAADPERAALEYLDWIEAELYPHLWPAVLSAVLEADSESVDLRCAQLWEAAPLIASFYLAGPAARGGDEAARAYLEQKAVAPEVEQRSPALQALFYAGFTERALQALVEDSDPVLRSTMAGLLADLQPDPAIDAALQQGLNDADDDVRALCLRTLVARGDDLAIDRALAGLRGGLRDLDEAVDALRGPALEADRELARRALDVLTERYAGELHLDWTARAATLQAIGQVPLPEAAEFLLARAREAAGSRLQGLDGHRWIAMQLANTGPAGRLLMADSLAQERDPLRRLDLIQGFGSARYREDHAAMLERVLAVVEEGQNDPYERLYAAQRAIQMGPMADVAPRLKRACLRIEHPRVRRALQCLLWKWF